MFLLQHHTEKVNKTNKKMSLRPKHSVAKSVSNRNSDRHIYIAKTQVVKSLVIEFIFGRYFTTNSATDTLNR